jgi:hypothetical protein
MAKSDSRGRTKTTRHIRLDHALLESPAYRSLSPLARSLLIEFTMLCKGPQNNGRFWLSIIDAAARGGVSCTKSTKAAIDELIEMGFIEMTEEANLSCKMANSPEPEHGASRLKLSPGSADLAMNF